MQALCRQVCCWVYLTRVQPTQTHPITSTASPDTLSNSQTPLHHITNASASTSAMPKNQSYPQLWRELYHHHHDHNDDQKVWTDNLLFSFDVDNASASPGARYPLDSASPGKNININLILMIIVNYHQNRKDHHECQHHKDHHHLHPQADWSFRTCSLAEESPFFTGNKHIFFLGDKHISANQRDGMVLSLWNLYTSCFLQEEMYKNNIEIAHKYVVKYE